MTDEKKPNFLDSINVTLSPDLYWEGSVDDYFRKVIENPGAVRTAHQRLYDAINFYGTEKYRRFKQNVIRYKIFDDPFTPDQRNAVYGNNVDLSLMKLVNVLGAAARGLGQEYRMYLLNGPIGTAKSTIARLLSNALEDYTKRPEGQLYSPYWEVQPGDEQGMEILGTIGRHKTEQTAKDCPLHEEPLAVLPVEIRREVIKELSKQAGREISVNTNACPQCDVIFEKFLKREGNDWRKVIEKHLRVRRLVLSKAKYTGIVVARPKAEKDQDVTEFLGEHNFRDLGFFGDTKDPRAYNFAGHYMAANRGFFYWEEQLKFALTFLYDLLGASMEHSVQPKGFREVEIDEVLFGSTNEPEFAELRENDKMQALRDRTIAIAIPYVLDFDNEKKVYEKTYTEKRRGGKHLAPHTVGVASFWTLLSRVTDPKRTDLDRRGKVKLYSGHTVPGFNEDSVREIMLESENEGMDGISPRYVQDKLSAAFVAVDDKNCVNPFSVLREMKLGLPTHPHIKSKEKRKLYEELIEKAQDELTDWLKDDLQTAISGDETGVIRLFSKYIDNIMAFVNKEKVKDPVTEEYIPPDEEFMRSIEDRIEIKDHEDFRNKISFAVAKRARDRERDPKIDQFTCKTDERLYKALKLKLFEEAKEKINWESLISRKAVDDDSQRQLDTIKKRMIEQLGYCDVCASEVMTHVASIFKRGEKAKANSKK